MNALKKAWATITRHRPYTAYQRYGQANGDLLAAGVGYYSFFSVFPAIALGFTVFGFVLQGRPELIETIADSLNTTFPNMIKTADNPDGFIGISAPSTVALTITGIVAFVTLLLSGLGWIGALRTGIRGVFGLEASDENAVKTKVRDLGVLVALGLGIALSAVLTSAVGGLAGQITAWLGIAGAEWLVTLVGILIGIGFDTLLMVVVLRVLSSVPLPWPNVRDGALFGAVLLTLLKVFGARLVAGATDNPLLGAVAVAVGLLFWLNLMARVILLSAAWAATHVDIDYLVDDDAVGAFARAAARPAFVMPLTGRADTSAVPYAGGPPRSEHVGSPRRSVGPGAPGATRSGDRVNLATGAVVGAALAAGAAALTRLGARLRRR